MAVKHDMTCCMGHLRNMRNGHHGQSWKVIALSVKRGTMDWETLLCMVCWTGYLSCGHAHSHKHVCILRCFWNKCACTVCKTSNSFGLLQSDGSNCTSFQSHCISHCNPSDRSPNMANAEEETFKKISLTSTGDLLAFGKFSWDLGCYNLQVGAANVKCKETVSGTCLVADSF